MSLSVRRRAVFLSDPHPDASHGHAGELADCLGVAECDRLQLVGDIVDL